MSDSENREKSKVKEILRQGYVDDGWTTLDMGDVIDIRNMHLNDAYWPQMLDLKKNSVVHSYSTLFSEIPHSLRISGECGSGKTTFCKKLAHDWAQGKLELQMFEYVFCIPLGEIGDDLAESPIERVVQILNPALDKKVDPEIIRDIIFKSPEKMLLILDGLDEYNMRNKDINKILKRKTLSNLHVLLTCRPETPCHEFLHLFTETDFLIRGFTKGSAWNLVGKRINDVKSCDDFLTQAIAKGLEECLCNPFLCLLLTALYQDSKPQTLPDSITEMYREIIQIFQFNAKRKHPEMKEVEAVRQLEELAYELKMTSQSETQQFPEQDVLRLGIASGEKVGKLKTRRKMKITFMHGSLQDFLLASWVVSNNIDVSDWWKCKNNMIIKFICGLCKGKADKVAFRDKVVQKYIADLLLEHKIEDNMYLTGVQRYRGIINILNELNREMEPASSKYCNPLVLCMPSNIEIPKSAYAEEMETLPTFVYISFPLSHPLPRIPKTKTAKGSEVSLCIEFTKDISRELTQLVEWLPKRVPISYLHLQSNGDQFPDVTETNLVPYVCLTTLSSLQLSGIPNSLAEKILNIAADAKELNRLVATNLRGPGSRDVALSAMNLLCSTAVHSKLECLNLSDMDIPHGSDVFALVGKCKMLKYISMEKVNLKNQMTKETCIHDHLISMALNDCQLGDSDFKCIVEKLKDGRLPNLQYLDLSNSIDIENLENPSYWSNSASPSMKNALKEAVAEHEERNGPLQDVLYPLTFKYILKDIDLD